MNGVLRFDALVCGYGDTMVLRGLSGSAGPGRVLGVLGRNGVGKTTLMRALAGFLPLREGTLTLGGHDLSQVAPHQRLARGMAYAPQEDVVFGDLSVQENLWLHLDDRDPQRYAACLQAFPRLGERMAQRAGSLSGGERKLLSFTRTMGLRAALSLLDEPTEGVQPENIERMAALLRARKAEGAGFVIVEQNLEFLLAVADDLMAIDHGECLLKGAASEFGRAALEAHLMV
ncbi:ABC transporter ATP-binding protein [Variovorax ginsengisoli]|uniref:ATP-binding cassette domain-containing protein n=1 Tax=Variovorax ginsengisoli TaxID=363844 RepID=A0ABT8SA51_9BURK|nr:ATP-binding cassette domain-containing protein [Variovorax ginsengisoli]MDN8616611.1 ATP-binding cassette domain-containing protein [Variovorax ginsengisoli]MDO1535781.1 ATP-binding cassette domain-containing protein [Variovorax ginsengisoli]